jgi:3-oxoadipate enol-lactonase
LKEIDMTGAAFAGGDKLIVPRDWLPAGLSRMSIDGAESGKQLAIYIGGPETADAILFNSSILTDSRVWMEQAVEALELGYRVVCVDFRGHGASSAFSPPYTMRALIQDDIAVLDRLKIARAHVVGVSMGGMIGLGLGILHPERVLSLTLCAARGDAPAAFAAAWDERIVLANKEGTAALVASTCERWLGAGYASHPAYGLIAQMIEGTSTEGFVGGAQAIQKLNFLEHAGEIEIPTLLIVGNNDTGMLQPMHALHKQINGARLAVMADAGHLPQLDNANEFNTLLFDHVKSSGAAGA